MSGEIVVKKAYDRLKAFPISVLHFSEIHSHDYFHANARLGASM